MILEVAILNVRRGQGPAFEQAFAGGAIHHRVDARLSLAPPGAMPGSAGQVRAARRVAFRSKTTPSASGNRQSTRTGSGSSTTSTTVPRTVEHFEMVCGT